jgi:hypothetical protein
MTVHSNKRNSGSDPKSSCQNRSSYLTDNLPTGKGVLAASAPLRNVVGDKRSTGSYEFMSATSDDLVFL